MIHEIKLKEKETGSLYDHNYSKGCEEFWFKVRGYKFNVRVEYDYLLFLDEEGGNGAHSEGVSKLCKALGVRYTVNDPLVKYFKDNYVFGHDIRVSSGAFPVFPATKRHRAILNMLNHFTILNTFKRV